MTAIKNLINQNAGNITAKRSLTNQQFNAFNAQLNKASAYPTQTTYKLADGRSLVVTGNTAKLSGGGFDINYTGVKTDAYGNVTAEAGSGTRNGKPTYAKSMNGNALTVDAKSGKVITWLTGGDYKSTVKSTDTVKTGPQGPAGKDGKDGVQAEADKNKDGIISNDELRTALRPDADINGDGHVTAEELAKTDKGEKGERGKRGEKGEKGDQGERGEKGERGKRGEKGEKGDQGERGEKGERGKRGEKGEKGDQGERGEKGERGKRGEKGEKGEKGEQGERGERGAKGEKGDRGEKGEQGERGERGERGKRGKRGADASANVTINFGGRKSAAYAGLQQQISQTLNLVNKAANQQVSFGGSAAGKANDVSAIMKQIAGLLTQLLDAVSGKAGSGYAGGSQGASGGYGSQGAGYAGGSQGASGGYGSQGAGYAGGSQGATGGYASQGAGSAEITQILKQIMVLLQKLVSMLGDKGGYSQSSDAYSAMDATKETVDSAEKYASSTY